MTDTLANYRVEIIDDPNPDLQEAVNAALRHFNQNSNPQFWVALAQPENAAKPLNIFVFGTQNEVVGGLFATTQFLWLKVSIMSVHEELRGQGIGTAMMQMAEDEARRRGCRCAYVDTMDYQAPQFYVRLGYHIVGRLDNWDSHGHSKLFLTKEIT